MLRMHFGMLFLHSIIDIVQWKSLHKILKRGGKSWLTKGLEKGCKKKNNLYLEKEGMYKYIINKYNIYYAMSKEHVLWTIASKIQNEY